MQNAATAQVNCFWNSPLCVDTYDAGHAEGIGVARDDAVWREAFIHYLPPAPCRIADIGCGTGFASVLLAELGHQVSGLDQGANMLAAARQKAAERQLAIPFVQGNAMAADVPRGLARRPHPRHGACRPLDGASTKSEPMRRA